MYVEKYSPRSSLKSKWGTSMTCQETDQPGQTIQKKIKYPGPGTLAHRLGEEPFRWFYLLSGLTLPCHARIRLSVLCYCLAQVFKVVLSLYGSVRC